MIVSSPPLLHFDHVRFCILNGIDIICDKPPVAIRNQFIIPNAQQIIKGRLDDTVFIFQQGGIQSFHILLSDDAGGAFPHGDIRYIRRCHPLIAQKLKIPNRQVIDIPWYSDTSKKCYHQLVKDFLCFFSNKNSANLANNRNGGFFFFHTLLL